MHVPTTVLVLFSTDGWVSRKLSVFFLEIIVSVAFFEPQRNHTDQVSRRHYKITELIIKHLVRCFHRVPASSQCFCYPDDLSRRGYHPDVMKLKEIFQNPDVFPSGSGLSACLEILSETLLHRLGNADWASQEF